MLRTKQLGTLSQTARSFLLSGSRSSAADGSSCSCSEDETCISKRQQTGDAIIVKALQTNRTESVEKPASLSQSIPNSGSLQQADFFLYAVENDVNGNSSTITGQFVTAGITAVNIISDLINFKIPASDGVNSHQNYMVNRTNPVSSVKPTNPKHYQKCDARVVETSPAQMTTTRSIEQKDHILKESPSEALTGSDTARNSSVTTTKGKSEKYRSNKGANNFRNYSAVNRVDVQDRRPVPYRGQDFSNQYVPIVPAADYSKPEMGNYVRDMRASKSVLPTARQFSSTRQVVERVFNILLRLEWGPAAEEALWKLNCPMDAYIANQILKQLQDHSVALGFFYWLKGQDGFKHDDHTYTTMVGILGRARQFGPINKLLDQMVQDGCKPNVVTYNRLIHSYGRANYLNKALDVFKLMQNSGCEPDRVTFCTLIDIHAKAGYLEIAMDMYRRMQEAGLSPDTFTYTVIINCLGKAGHLASAQRLFSEMVRRGCVPNLVTYNIMIALQAKARNYQSALQIYRDMQKAGFDPDKVTYSIVMEVLGHCGYLEEAEAVFEEMKMKNWVPDEPVYGILVDLWGKSGNAERAWAWYQAMLDAGLRPNMPTCNSLLSAFLRVHRLSDAYSLVQSILNLGLIPTLQTYTLLLSCCTEACTGYEMSFCCELMGFTGHPAHTFLLSMPAAGPDGQNVRDHVGKFLDLMHSEDRESKRGLVDAVVDFLHKSGLKEEAGSVWEVAAQRNVYPDAVREKSSCYWLINLHVMSDGTAVTALSRTLAGFRKTMISSGICPSRIDIVTGWGRRSRVTGASLVRQSVQELLSIFSFPFFTENGNSGCFVGRGEPLSRWLLQSYVERMHLL